MKRSVATRQASLRGLAALLLFCCATAPSADGEPRVYDLVVKGGRVIDPESGLDAVRDVGIRDGTIAAISETPLRGELEVDASSRVVAPGFIDLHTHSPTPLGQKYQLLDGVTTALELEAGAHPVEGYGRQIEDRALSHYGASVGYGSVRLAVMMGLRSPHPLTDPPTPVGWLGAWTILRSLFGTADDVVTKRAGASQRAEARSLLEQGLAAGGIGFGLPLDYMCEAVDAAELRMIFDVAAEWRAPVFVHLRRGVNGDPAGLDEALELAAETGAPLHVCHVSHNAMRAIDDFLARIRAASAAGVDVTAEVLPYNAGSAPISSAVFGRDWQTVFDITYEDVEWAATGERFTEAMWNDYRKNHPDGQVIHHYLKDEWTRRALVEPGVIVVSDLLPMKSEDELVAPHNGAFSRVLGRYTRDEGVLELGTALAKMTLLPARRLETVAPAFEKKGRVQVGADADLVVFDPATVRDRATYQDPFQPPEGIPHVIVAGRWIVRDGAIQEGLHPGTRITGAGHRGVLSPGS